MLIRLDTMKNVGEFVQIAQSESQDVMLKSLNGKYIIDGKSLLGVLSLDLTNAIRLELESKNYHLFDKFKAE